ncbi:mitochondrial ribosomal subunit S27-domain-containing protein [Sordaria brevicollis]|uniref:Small ribosomal subunit protein mS33 n=1 Tax=Sordaria brevicollis TaxID=83679 RepID=A0AAE0UB48_SORBR|nr:mitochondrial ribosomal subunit S27-domain-containing protein [Sordaria brevicollis]
MSVPRARLLQLVKVRQKSQQKKQPLGSTSQLTGRTQARCELFSTTFNPEGIRTGNKILRQRLKGPSLVAYYPRKNVGIRELQKEFAPLGLEVDDEVDEDRLEHLAALRARDKGAPKKKRTAPAATDKKKK